MFSYGVLYHSYFYNGIYVYVYMRVFAYNINRLDNFYFLFYLTRSFIIGHTTHSKLTPCSYVYYTDHMKCIIKLTKKLSFSI